MPDLDDQQQHDVIFLMGLPMKVIRPDSTDYDRIIHERLMDLAQPTVDRVAELLALIKDTRSKLDATSDDANVSQVGEIGLDPTLTSHYIRKNYNRYLRELSQMLDIPMIAKSGMIGF